MSVHASTDVPPRRSFPDIRKEHGVEPGRAIRTPPRAVKIRAPKRPAGTLYRGREGMWSWVLHRITGTAIFFFLLVHILDTALIRIDAEAYNAVIGTYKTPIMGLGELALVAAIGLHALNGLRIIAIDFFSWGTEYQRVAVLGRRSCSGSCCSPASSPAT